MAFPIDPVLSRDGVQDEDANTQSHDHQFPPQHYIHHQQHPHNLQDFPQPIQQGFDQSGPPQATNGYYPPRASPSLNGLQTPSQEHHVPVGQDDVDGHLSNHGSEYDFDGDRSNHGSEQEREASSEDGEEDGEEDGLHESIEPNSPGPSQEPNSPAKGKRRPKSVKPIAPAKGKRSPKSPKSRACDNCRSAKVGCTFMKTRRSPSEFCIRCKRMCKPCVVSEPVRKRAKRTDPRSTAVLEILEKLQEEFAEKFADTSNPSVTAFQEVLEKLKEEAAEKSNQKGIDGKNSFNQKGIDGKNSSNNQTNVNGAAPRSTAQDTSHGGAAPGMNGTHKNQQSLQPSSSLSEPMKSRKRKHVFTRDNVHEEIRETINATAGPRPVDVTGPGGTSPLDVIDRGFLTEVEADQLFRQYTDDTAPHVPGVVFSEGTTWDQVRREKPLLFLSILAASSSDIPDLRQMLVKELMLVFPNEFFVTGPRAMELIQAIHVSVIWYWVAPQTDFDNLKFYRFFLMALACALDLGLGKKPDHNRFGVRKRLNNEANNEANRGSPTPDPTTVESRRVWLTTYLLASSTSMSLRKPYLIRWDDFLDECFEVLSTSPDAAPTDKYLCRLVETHRMAEDIGTRFAMHDAEAVFDITSVPTQVALGDFERRLAKFQKSLTVEDKQQPSLQIAVHTLDVYMHESAITVHPEELEEGMSEEAQDVAITRIASQNFTSEHMAALARCVYGAHQIVAIITSLSVETVRQLPVFNFVRVACVVLVLLRLHHAARVPGSALGKIFPPERLNIENCLVRLVTCYEAASAEDKCNPATRFLPVIRLWQSSLLSPSLPDSNGASSQPASSGTVQGGVEGSAADYNHVGPNGTGQHGPNGTGQQQQYHSQPNYSAVATPLQALAEVASSANGAMAGPSTSAPGCHQHQSQRAPSWNGNGNVNGNGKYSWPSSGTPQALGGYYNNPNPTIAGSSSNGMSAVNHHHNPTMAGSNGNGMLVVNHYHNPTMAGSNSNGMSAVNHHAGPSPLLPAYNNNNNMEQGPWSPFPNENFLRMGFLGDALFGAAELTGLAPLGMMDPAGYNNMMGPMPPPNNYVHQQHQQQTLMMHQQPPPPSRPPRGQPPPRGQLRSPPGQSY